MHAKGYFLSGSNLARIAGFSLMAVSLVFGILAAGNLYFIRSPDDLVQQFRSQLASQMAASNVPPEFRERFTSGTLLSDEDRAKLTPEAKEVIEKFESMLPVLRTAVNRAVEQSRTKSQFGLTVCAVVFVGGILLVLVSRRVGRTIRRIATTTDPNERTTAR